MRFLANRYNRNYHSSGSVEMYIESAPSPSWADPRSGRLAKGSRDGRHTGRRCTVCDHGRSCSKRQGRHPVGRMVHAVDERSYLLDGNPREGVSGFFYPVIPLRLPFRRLRSSATSVSSERLRASVRATDESRPKDEARAIEGLGDPATEFVGSRSSTHGVWRLRVLQSRVGTAFRSDQNRFKVLENSVDIEREFRS